MKLAVGLAELIGLATVVGLLRAGGRPALERGDLRLEPVGADRGLGMGHLDGLVVPAVAGAVWMALRGRHAVAGALLGGGALLKLYPAALLALLPIPAWPAAVTGFAAVILAGYVPGLLAGTEVLGSLPRYLTEEYFNPGLLRSVVDAPHLAVVAGSVWILAVGAWRRGRCHAFTSDPSYRGVAAAEPEPLPVVRHLVGCPSWRGRPRSPGLPSPAQSSSPTASSFSSRGRFPAGLVSSSSRHWRSGGCGTSPPGSPPSAGRSAPHDRRATAAPASAPAVPLPRDEPAGAIRCVRPAF